MKNHSQVHAHIDIDSRVMMATSCRQFENSVNNKIITWEVFKCESICISKLMKYGIFIPYSDSELPESMGVCLSIYVLHTEFYGTFKKGYF